MRITATRHKTNLCVFQGKQYGVFVYHGNKGNQLFI
jgi:hypothetical protein